MEVNAKDLSTAMRELTYAADVAEHGGEVLLDAVDIGHIRMVIGALESIKAIVGNIQYERKNLPQTVTGEIESSEAGDKDGDTTY